MHWFQDDWHWFWYLSENSTTMKNLLILLLSVLSLTGFAANKPFKAIDENGRVLFTIEAQSVYEFSNGLARIKQQYIEGNQWVSGYGYINTKGEIVIPCKFEKANDFVAGRAWVKNIGDEYWTLIDVNGTVIPTKKYTKVGYIFEWQPDRLAVYEGEAMGWIDRNGKEVIPCKYAGSSTFDREFGLACVSLATDESGKYGFLNQQGEVAIPFQYVQAGTSSFHSGYCRVSIQGKTVLIDEKGTVRFTPKYGSLQDLSHGLMAVATKPNRQGWGYLNLKNEMVIPGIYDEASTINEEGFATIEKSEKVGLIDSTGQLLLELKYATIYCEPKHDGYICAVYPVTEPTSLLETPKDYFNASFEKVDVGDVTLMSANGGKLIRFMTKEGRYGFMNRNFEIVIPAQFDKVTAFSEGIALVAE